jgi:hypothetical protein
MFRKCISKCFCLDSCVKDEENNETICLIPANIKKLIIVETEAKLPDITDKWKVIYFIDQANNISSSILGDCIDFHIQNPNEIVDKNNKSIKYKVNMYNKKTKILLNRLSFYFRYDIVEMGPILYIKPIRNEIVSPEHWGFLESLFYNMGYQIRKKYNKHK